MPTPPQIWGQPSPPPWPTSDTPSGNGGSHVDMRERVRALEVQSHMSANGHVYDQFAVGMLIGEIRQQGDHTRHRLDRIDHLLEHGDRRMSEMTERIASLERRPSAEIPAAERWVKDALRYAIPVAVLYGTGSVDAAAMWLKMLAAK